jgi:hypothetical protein
MKQSLQGVTAAGHVIANHMVEIKDSMLSLSLAHQSILMSNGLSLLMLLAQQELARMLLNHEPLFDRTLEC